jgi:hypothetical protein
MDTGKVAAVAAVVVISVLFLWMMRNKYKR